MNFQYELLVPEYLLAALAALLVILDFSVPHLRREHLAYIAAAGLGVVLIVSLLYINDSESFGELIQVDNYATFFRVFFIGISLVTCLASARYVPARLLHAGEYYALIILATIGMIYMATAKELLTAYIALELLSFSLYVLTSYAKFDPRSNEGGMKYMLLGAFSSAIFLYGLSIIYGVTGSTFYSDIAAATQGALADRDLALLLGLVLVVTGLGFKVSAVPFHMWAPDAYEGAPLPITAFISAASKAAGFAFFVRLFAGPFLPVLEDWRWMLAGVAAVTMVVGNLVAIQQHNIKRLLAYSSIGQVGYMVGGIAAMSPEAVSAVILHLTGYVVTNLAAFVCIIYYYNLTGKEEIGDYAGLAERQPFLALCLTISLFSLAGMPLFAGFATKFILFQAMAQEDMLWLAAVGVLMSFVSLYYYLMVIKQMYLVEPPEVGRFPLLPLEYAIVALLVVGIFFIGLYPQPLFDAIENSTQFIFYATQGAAVAGVP